MNASGIFQEIFGAAVIISLIMMAFQAQYSMISVQSDSAASYTRGEKLKVAGSLAVLDHGDDFGRLDSSLEYSNEGGWCRAESPVFQGAALAMKPQFTGDCAEPHRPVRSAFVFDGEGQTSSETGVLSVGGRE